MRIALVANRASGGGLDPAPLAAAMDGAEIFGCDEQDLERVREWGPERIAVAGGDGTLGPVAELAGCARRAARGDPDRHRQRLRPRPRASRLTSMEAARLAVRAPRCARWSWAAWPTGARS